MNHILRLLFIGFFSTLVFIAGCSGNSNSGVNKDPIQDLDGDGIADIVDPDIDGDGIPNEQDPDDDNDGVEDSVDPTPPVKPGTKTCTAASILPPEGDDHQLGDMGELGWELLPEGCVLPVARAAGQGVPVSATKDDDGEASDATAKAGNCDGRTPEQVQCGVDIEIPKGCGATGEEVTDVTYDISEIGKALGDIDLSKGVYKQTNKHRMPECPDGGTEPEPAQCPEGATGEYGDCDCGRGKGYNPDTNQCVEPNFEFKFGSDRYQIPYAVDALGNIEVEVPAGKKAFIYSGDGARTKLSDWARPSYSGSFSGEHYLQIKLTGGSPCQNQMVTIYKNTGLYTSDFGSPSTNKQPFENWEELRASEFGSCDLNQDWPCDGCTKGNFFLNLGEGEHTITKYSVKKATSPVTVLSTDVDNDGIPNDSDPDVDGDGIPNTSDKDIDGDGIENKNDPDIDGDGIPNTSDKDIDGDGIENKNDPDIDGDGIKNGIDKDSDGDGTPDAEDETPGGVS